MAKFVIAGKADCPYFAKAELLADFLHRTLSDFQVHKISVHPAEWKGWLERTCSSNGWEHGRSPIVWRELVHRGGKGKLLGGVDEFLEYAQGYYGATPHMDSDLLLKISAENLEAQERSLQEDQRRRELQEPLQVWISSALHRTGSHLIPLLFTSGALPGARSISLHLLDLDGGADPLRGLQMEIEDLALDRLHRVSIHADLHHAFLLAHLVVFLEERGPSRIAERYRRYANVLQENAAAGARVLVTGDAAVNLKCSLLMENAPSLQRRRLLGLGTCLENEARARLAAKLSVRTSDVDDVIIWGNISGRFHVDLQRARVRGYQGAVRGPAGFSQPVTENIHDKKWLKDELPRLLSARRGDAHLRAIAAADGILAVLKAWTGGSSSRIFSMGVVSTGQFGVPEGLVFCMPVTFHGGEWAVTSGVLVSGELRSEVDAAAQEIQEEKAAAEGMKVDGPDP